MALITSQPPKAPSILLTATLRWPIAARLAIAFTQLGCHVEAICPRQHPVTKVRSLARSHSYSVLKPMASLRAAIEAAAPDLVVPCDDNAAVHLQQLFVLADATDQVALRDLLARSLGSPEACALATRRGKFIAMADDVGVRVPFTSAIATVDALEAWLAQHGLPAVIKVDCSWGGQGVSVVRTREEARRAFIRMALRPAIVTAVVRMVLERDGSFLLNAFRTVQRGVTVQKFVVGSPANRAVACWQGKVLAGISVQSIETQHSTGPATVVRVIENAEMEEAARSLVRRLGISGLWGIDFVLQESGAAYVIEMNPRATPICHLPVGPQQNLPVALYRCLRGVWPVAVPETIEQDVIAMFPGEWHRNSASSYLRSAYHDIPWDEPALIQDCIDKPWSERGVVARLWSRMRRTMSKWPRRSTASIASGQANARRDNETITADIDSQMQADEQAGS